MRDFIHAALRLYLIAFLILGQCAPALAMPQGGEVVGGQATIVQESANKLGITQQTQRAIINWKSFGINENELVQFYQPNASAVALNRVVGSDVSRIMGQLKANGRIFLVNSNGIVFGKNSRIDTAGFLATTHDIDNDAFMRGDYTFNIPGKIDASIINNGTIRVGDTGIASFVAPSVVNNGVIVAKLGKVALASANGFTLDFYGDNLLTFLVDEDKAGLAMDTEGKPLESFVGNYGTISADGGYVLLTARNAQSLIHSVVNQSGTIEANSVESKNGVIVLSGGQGSVTNDGLLSASGDDAGESGGTVAITGSSIELASGSQIDVSGQRDGGQVVVGDAPSGHVFLADATASAFLDGYADQFMADDVFMDEAAWIVADSLTSGDGGDIILWSTDSTEAHGTLTARGGAQGGDGGFIETSSLGSVIYNGVTASASAANGLAGTWLLDPYDLTINADTATDIESSLNDGTNVSMSASNNLDIIADIIKSSGDDASLTFHAYFIYLHEGVDILSGAGKLDVDFEATDRVWIGRGYSGGESCIATNGGDITLHGPNFVGVNGDLDAGEGNILIRAENKESTGADKGIWIYGTTRLAGGSIRLVTNQELREDEGSSRVIQEATLADRAVDIVDDAIDEAEQKGIIDKAKDVASLLSTDLRKIPKLTKTKGMIKAVRSMSGTTKKQFEKYTDTLGVAGKILTVASYFSDVVQIANASNIGAYASAVNTIVRNFIKDAGAAAGAAVGKAAGGLLGGLAGGIWAPITAFVGGIAGSMAGGYVAEGAYNKLLARTVVQFSSLRYRGKINRLGV